MAILIKQLHGHGRQFASTSASSTRSPSMKRPADFTLWTARNEGRPAARARQGHPATPTAERSIYKKTTVAAAIDDVYSKQTQLQTAIDAKAAIDDANAKSTTTAYSAKKVEDLLVALKQAVKNELLGGAGEAVDTLKELADLISTNKDAIAATADDRQRPCAF